MEIIEHGQFVREYKSAFRNPRFIPMVEEETKQDWGYLQWNRASTGGGENHTISDYRSNLVVSLNPLFVPLEECQVERLKPLIEEMSSINKKLEECVWNYRNTFNIQVSRNDGWGLLRASNTTPKLVLRFEANSPERLNEIRNIFLNQLKIIDETIEIDIS